MIAGPESDLPRGHTPIPAEKHPKVAAAEAEGIPVPLEVVAVGSPHFLRTEEVAENLDTLGGLIQGEAPEMDLRG